MAILYRPNTHKCVMPFAFIIPWPVGTLFQCDECIQYPAGTVWQCDDCAQLHLLARKKKRHGGYEAKWRRIEFEEGARYLDIAGKAKRKRSDFLHRGSERFSVQGIERGNSTGPLTRISITETT